MTFEQVVFYVLGAVTIFSAVMMLLQRNPVNSALFLILNFFCLGGLYLTLNAQFIAVVHVTVYAGAIMVLFIFVIMLLSLGDEKRLREHLGVRMYFGIGFSILLFVELLYILGFSSANLYTQQSPAAIEMGTVEYLGKVLFTKFLFPFEVTSFLLLAAIIGAVILAKKNWNSDTMIPLSHYLLLSAFLFCCGVLGVVVRRNAIIVFMSIELMLNSVNLTLVAYSAYLGDVTGQMLVFFVMVVAAAEAAVGLAIIIALFRNKQTVNIDELNILKW